MNFYEALLEPSLIILGKIGVFFLILLTVFLFLLFGWFLALVVKKILLKVFRKIDLDRYFKNTWMGKFLSRGGITKMPAELLSGFFYWLIIVIFVVIASQSLGIESTGDLLDRFLIFLPRVLAFGLILIFGIVFAGFIGKLFQIISGNLGIKEAKTIGRLLQGIIIIYAVIMALEQLGIAVFAVAASFNIFWAAICLTLVLALGLGGKDLVKGFLDNFAKKLGGNQGPKKQNTRSRNRKKERKNKDLQEMFPYDQRGD